MFIKDVNRIPTVSIFHKKDNNTDRNSNSSTSEKNKSNDKNTNEIGKNVKSMNKKKSAKKVIEKNILSVENIDIENTDIRSSRNKRKVSNNDSFDNDERIIQDSDGETSLHDTTPTNTPSKKPKN